MAIAGLHQLMIGGIRSSGYGQEIVLASALLHDHAFHLPPIRATPTLVFLPVPSVPDPRPASCYPAQPALYHFALPAAGAPFPAA